jgi:hypothetical protein
MIDSIIACVGSHKTLYLQGEGADNDEWYPLAIENIRTQPFLLAKVHQQLSQGGSLPFYIQVTDISHKEPTKAIHRISTKSLPPRDFANVIHCKLLKSEVSTRFRPKPKIGQSKLRLSTLASDLEEMQTPPQPPLAPPSLTYGNDKPAQSRGLGLKNLVQRVVSSFVSPHLGPTATRPIQHPLHRDPSFRMFD